MLKIKKDIDTFLAWSVHLLTCSGLIAGFLALICVFKNDETSAFLFLGLALLIDAYRNDAQMNGLKFDSHTEEKAVELFAANIMKAGDAFYQNPMDTPFIPTWSRVKSAIPDFLIRLEKAVNEDNMRYI